MSDAWIQEEIERLRREELSAEHPRIYLEMPAYKYDECEKTPESPDVVRGVVIIDL